MSVFLVIFIVAVVLYIFVSTVIVDRLFRIVIHTDQETQFSTPYRQKVVLVLPKHLNADNMAVRPIAKELRVTRVKNSSRGAW